METYKEIFKSYDIRGIYNSQINEKITENIGKLFAKLLKKLNKSKNHKLRVIIGRDCRISSKKLYNAFIKGIISQNVEITKVSECSTDMINFATKFYNFNGGVMITASHNPKEYNGIKLYGPSGESIGKNEGLFLIKNWLEKKDIPKSTKKGNIKYKNILDDYINYLIKITKINQIKPIKVVLDAGNGMAVKLINKMEEKIHKIKFLKLNFKIDGNFPGRGPNPVLKGALKKLQTKCKKLKTFGIAFDGDADRAVFVDETGRIVNGDFVLCLLSKYFLNKNKNKKIIYNVMGSRIVKETIKKYKGIPIIAPVGHTHIQNLMKKQKAILGGETSGHYFFENFFYIDSGALAMLYIIKIVSNGSGIPLSTDDKHNNRVNIITYLK